MNVKMHLFVTKMPLARTILDHIHARAIRAYLEMVKIPVLVSFVSKSSLERWVNATANIAIVLLVCNHITFC